MKLYRVKIEYEIVILASSESDAESQADCIIKNDDDSDPYCDATEIKTVQDLPDGWIVDCQPFGEQQNGYITIGEILKEQNK